MGLLRRISSLALILKKGNAEAGAACSKIIETLERRKLKFGLIRHPEDAALWVGQQNADLILVLGGDGTLISVARQCLGLAVPIGGINFGRVGFLNELSPRNCLSVLEKTLDEGVAAHELVSLAFTLTDGNGCEKLRGEAVNDVTITRGKIARLSVLDIAADAVPFVSLRSDGLIFSTPTGATGYSCSAGGPLIWPGLNAYAVTAICPYLNNFPPLVLSPETVFTVRIGEASPEACLAVDGQETHRIGPGDLLKVNAVRGRLLMADFGVSGYFDRLLRCGFVRGGRQNQE
ncbi:MAG: NAD(+)/NADH kinase [Desulfovibrio sp.]|jgi:NAD+ kinase|nr:NAD(+)/NADH kinase [Desulfovibrio sp.]